MPRGIYKRQIGVFKRRPGLKRGPGAGRPPKYVGFELKPVRLMLPKEYVDAIDAQAKERKISRADIFYEILFTDA